MSHKPYIIWLSFIVHLCKVIISPGVFVIFSKVLIFLVHRGVKGQKIAQNDKKLCPLHSISQEPYIIWPSFMVHICEMIISWGGFFYFFKILIFWVHRGVKGKKRSRMTKNCLMRFIFQQPYSTWLSQIVPMCKLIMSPGVLLNVNLLIFQVVKGLKGQKMPQNDKKFCLPHSVSEEPYIIWLWFLVHMCKMMISPATFFILKILILEFLGS